MKNDLDEVFRELIKIVSPYADRLDSTTGRDGDLHIDTSHIMKNGKPLFFGAVKILKASVAFHLMPVYVNSGLLENVSPGLKKRMRGKSCFHFTAIDAALFTELKALTRRGFEDYEKQGYVS